MSEVAARRLVWLDEVSLSEADRESVVAELAAFEEALRRLEPFAEDVLWTSLQIQPYAYGTEHDQP